jgi:mannose-6-phosphate isomerase-like protein (cupin superfamily)
MYSENIEKLTLENSNFRHVIYTSPEKDFQLVLMSLKPYEDIGMEIHVDITQFFRVESGSGKIIVDGIEKNIKNGDVAVVPKGHEHNIINTGSSDLKLYTIYVPANHPDGKIQPVKVKEGGSYYKKYLKYKQKYLNSKWSNSHVGGCNT